MLIQHFYKYYKFPDAFEATKLYIYNLSTFI